MKTKSILFSLFFLFLMNFGYSQVYKFMTTGFSVMEKNKKGNWGDWSDFEKASIMISLDTNKNRIVVYSQEIQLYTILSYGEVEENDKDLIYSFACEDIDKMPFTISIITRKKQNNRKQLYINQENVIIAYNIQNFNDKS